MTERQEVCGTPPGFGLTTALAWGRGRSRRVFTLGSGAVNDIETPAVPMAGAPGTPLSLVPLLVPVSATAKTTMAESASIWVSVATLGRGRPWWRQAPER